MPFKKCFLCSSNELSVFHISDGDEICKQYKEGGSEFVRFDCGEDGSCGEGGEGELDYRVVLRRLEVVDAAPDSFFLNFVFIFDLFLNIRRNAAPERLVQEGLVLAFEADYNRRCSSSEN